MATVTNYAQQKAMDIPSLVSQIQASSIVTVLDHITVTGNETDIWFKDVLSNADQSTLATVVTNYVYVAPPASVQNVAVQVTPPFGSKTITINGVTKNLYARFTGFQSSVVIGSNTINYTATYAWAKLIGIEVTNANAGDYASLEVYDDANGTYSGHANLKLNQFAYTLNIAKDFYQKMAQFDADLYVGMVVKITYHTTSITNTIGINLLMNEVK